VKVGISGMPGVGKTTLAVRVVEAASSAGLKVSGFVTKEVRSGRERAGFSVVRLTDGATAVLARVGSGEPRVGKYVVDLSACRLMAESLAPADLLVVDEVGAMEAKCPGFLDAVRSAVAAAPRALLVVHRNYVSLVEGWGVEVLWLTREEWSRVLSLVLAKLSLSRKV
jgi:nucleoside-triphosphatase